MTTALRLNTAAASAILFTLSVLTTGGSDGTPTPVDPSSAPRNFIYFGLERSRISEPAFLDVPAIAGAQLKYTWRELEPEPDQYALGPLLADLAFLEQHGKRLWVQLQDVSFEERIINVPEYLLTDPAFSGGVARQYSFEDEARTILIAEGWVARRWDPEVRARFIRLLDVLADSLDGRIDGINFAETSVGFGRPAVNDPAGYSPQSYANGVKAIMSAARGAFRRTHVIQYANFMPGESLPDDDHGYLRGIYAHADSLGVGVGNPDMLPFRWFQRQHSYPLIAARAEGTLAGAAVQWGNLDDRHRQTGEQVTVDVVYRYARDDLRLDYLFWGTQEPYYSRNVLPYLRGLAEARR